MLRHQRSVVRRAPLLGLLAVAVFGLSLAGCDAMIIRATPQPSLLVATPEARPPTAPTTIDEAPTVRPEPSGGVDLVAAANALADLDSYRVSVESRGLVPAMTTGGRVTMTSTLVQGADPGAQFAMTGVDGFAGGQLQAIMIGEEAWLKEGGAGWRKSPGGAADFDAALTTLSPIDLVSGFDGLAAAMTRVGVERRNGLRTIHYASQAGDDRALAAGLTEGTTDLWLALDGGHLVGLAIDGIWDLEGTPTPISLTIDITHVNDPANRVSAPG